MSQRIPPQRIALVTDVHGNLPAFQAVLDDIEAVGVEETWCLGDVIGYGAQPDECVALARESCDRCLVGNHDLVVLDKLDISDFSAGAAAAAEWTKENIAPASVEFLTALEPQDGTQAIGLYHASPRDPVWEYVLSSWQAELCFEQMAPRVGAIGHSHVALYFHQSERGNATGAQVPGGTTLDISGDRWLINPGSAGQPRDGDPRAAWLLLDLQKWHAEWRRVEYPIDVAARAIEDAGLPTTLAQRLYVGQ